MSETIQIGSGQFLEVIASSEDVLVLETTYAPGGSPPPAHFHPAQTEHFEILAGTVQAEVDGRRRVLATGEQLDVPPSAAHKMWNPSDEAARARWETRPAGRTEQWFRGLAALQGTNWVNRDGQPKPLAFAALASEYRDSFRLAGPQWLIRPALAAASAIARLRGFRAPLPALCDARSAIDLTMPSGGNDMALIHAQDREGSTVRGEDYGASISLILDESEPGQGPRLHRHAYDETWVIQEGNITFQVGDERFEAGPGDVAIIPPGAPHKFTNNGPGRSKIVCIHASPTIVGEWLE